jgi:hypothetical protein
MLHISLHKHRDNYTRSVHATVRRCYWELQRRKHYCSHFFYCTFSKFRKCSFPSVGNTQNIIRRKSLNGIYSYYSVKFKTIKNAKIGSCSKFYCQSFGLQVRSQGGIDCPSHICGSGLPLGYPFPRFAAVDLQLRDAPANLFHVVESKVLFLANVQ